MVPRPPRSIQSIQPRPRARSRLVGGAAGEEVVEYVEEGGVLELGEEDRLERRRRDQVAPNI